MLESLVNYAIKIALTGGLIFVIALCGALVFRLWFDHRLVLSPFEHLSATEASPAKGQYFTQLVAEHLQELHALYTGESTGRATEGAPLIPSTDQVGRGFDLTLPTLPDLPFSAIDVEAYGVRVTALLTDLWRWIERPRAIGGKLWEMPERVRVGASLSASQTGVSARWSIEEKTLEDASTELACRILHTLLAGAERPVFRDTTTVDFCLFTRAWRAYQNYRFQLLDVRGQDKAEEALKEAAGLIDIVRTRQSPFPFVPKLAALIRQEQGRPQEARTALQEYRRRLENYEIADERLPELEQQVAILEAPESLRALGLRERVRPLKSGLSVASESVTAGTLCCFVRDDHGIYVLSADHILDGEPGDQVLQPAPIDGGKVEEDVVATLTRIQKAKGGVANRGAGAIGQLATGIEVDLELPGIGRLNGVANEVQLGERLQAIGRTSGLVEGTVTGIDATIQISFGAAEVRRFDGMIVTSPMSAGGDGGAPVVNMRNELVGMVYGGSASNTIVMPIQPVLDALEVSLLTE